MDLEDEGLVYRIHVAHFPKVHNLAVGFVY